MALAFRQGVTANDNTGTAVTGNFASQPTVGQLIVMTIADDSGGTTAITSITDSAGGNTWNNIFSVGSSASLHAYYCKIANTTASFNITINWDTAATGRVAAAAQEFSGFTGVPTLDINGVTQGATNTTPTSQSIANAQANEIIIGCANHAGTTSAFTLGSGYTNLGTVNVANAAVAQESKIVAAVASQQATFTIAASRAWACNIVSFYDAVAAASTKKLTMLGVG